MTFKNMLLTNGGKVMHFFEKMKRTSPSSLNRQLPIQLSSMSMYNHVHNPEA